MNNTVKKENH